MLSGRRAQPLRELILITSKIPGKVAQYLTNHCVVLSAAFLGVENTTDCKLVVDGNVQCSDPASTQGHFPSTDDRYPKFRI